MIKKMTYYKSKNELELEEARKAQNKKIRELEEEIDNRKDEYKKVIDRENERVYNCNEYFAETMETRRKNMELKEENKKLKEKIAEYENLPFKKENE